MSIYKGTTLLAGLPDISSKANKDLSNVSSNIDYVVESYQNGTEWYRLYKSGWVEQGGEESSSSNQNKTVTFLVPFADTNYTYIATPITSSGSAEIGVFSKTTTTITTNVYAGGAQGFSWVAFGKKS